MLFSISRLLISLLLINHNLSPRLPSITLKAFRIEAVSLRLTSNNLQVFGWKRGRMADKISGNQKVMVKKRSDENENRKERKVTSRNFKLKGLVRQ